MYRGVMVWESVDFECPENGFLRFMKRFGWLWRRFPQAIGLISEIWYNCFSDAPVCGMEIAKDLSEIYPRSKLRHWPPGMD